jgi:hypothetical protein
LLTVLISNAKSRRESRPCNFGVSHGRSASKAWATRVPTLKTMRNIVAEYPGADPREISGLRDNADVDDWMNGDRRVAWLRSQVYARPELGRFFWRTEPHVTLR